MEICTGDDLVSLKESIRGQYSPSADDCASIANAGEYARYHGLTIDSLCLDWQQLVECDDAITSTLTDLGPGQLFEGTQLQECLFRAIIPTPEQWQMPVASLQILQEVCKRRPDEDMRALASQECFAETSKLKRLKLDPPALRSDHATDCRRLTRRVKGFLKEPLPEHRLPLHPVDNATGEGLDFPSNAVEMDRQQTRMVEAEHLEVARTTLVYLMQSLKSDLVDDDDMRQMLIESVSSYRGIGAREHLTPPLSPMTVASHRYFVPNDVSCEIPPASDPSSRLSEDINAAESRILQAERRFWDEAMENDFSPERYAEVDVSEMIRAGKFRPLAPTSSPQPLPRDLRVEVPLLPRSDDHDIDRADNKILMTDDLETARELVVSSDTLSGSDGPTGQLVALFREKEVRVTRCIEQEKLQPLDATARVPIPVLDFSITVPEWEERLWEPKKMFRWIQRDTDVDWQGPKWTHNRTAEQRMVWAPLAHMETRKLVAEQIEVDPGVVEFFLNRGCDDEVPTSADYVYKRPWLAVLRPEDGDEDEDDYLMSLSSSEQAIAGSSEPRSELATTSSMTEPSQALQSSSSTVSSTATPPPTDLTTLLTGRKLIIDERLQQRQSSRKRQRGHEAVTEVSATDVIEPTLLPSTNVLRGFMSEYTDFGPLVDNFIEMNFPKKPNLTHSTFFNPPTTPSSAKQLKADETAKLMPPPAKPIPALAPEITQLTLPPRVIISSTTSQLITQHLQTLLPGIELIPRDPTKHHPPGWIPGSRAPNLDEADLVISPATGILLTTMIHLRQKPVPGLGHQGKQQPPSGRSGSFRRVMANVAARHARLVVLVSEGNKHSETACPLAGADARALAEFQGFAAALSSGTEADAAAEVQLVYVGGGVETLAKWVAAVICEYASEADAVRELLLPMETSWEVFLRRAGMNVFAAQVVLGRLKVPEGEVAIGSAGVFGLPRFVTMSRHERIEMFEDAFGGRRVLERVSDAIDEPWGERAVDDMALGIETWPKWEQWG